MALVNFIRQGANTVAQTINFSVGGSATFNTDYTVVFPSGITGTWAAASGSVTIPIGSSQVDVTLNITADSVLETDETVLITITSTSPVVGISSANNAAVLVIKNDDFNVHLKVIGVGANSTALVGSFIGANTAFTGSNAGNAPANWTNWLTGVAGNANAPYDASAASIPTVYPLLRKMVMRSPTVAVVNTTTTYQTHNEQTLVDYSFRGNASGTWDLGYTLSSGGGFVTIFPNVPLSTWLDLIVEQQATSTTYVINGTTTFTAPAGIALNSNSTRFLFRNNTAFAAYSYNSGLAYSASMFPITPANL